MNAGTNHGGLLDAGVHVCPLDVILGCQLAEGDGPPVPAGKPGIGVAAAGRVAEKLLESLLGEGRMSPVARGGGRVSLVFDEAVAVS